MRTDISILQSDVYFLAGPYPTGTPGSGGEALMREDPLRKLAAAPAAPASRGSSAPTADGQRRARQPGTRAGSDTRADDGLIAREPMVGMLQHDAERVLTEMLSSEPDAAPPLDLVSSTRRRHSSTRGVRHFLRRQEGEGYWDFFKLSDSLMLSVTDATYVKDAW